MSEHSLRDLADKLYAVAREHPAYGQASHVVQNCCDHLTAIAAYHEANARAEELRNVLTAG